jgi:hypothetical protein
MTNETETPVFHAEIGEVTAYDKPAATGALVGRTLGLVCPLMLEG